MGASQSESQNPSRFSGETDFLKVEPNSCEPFRYLKTCFAAPKSVSADFDIFLIV